MPYIPEARRNELTDADIPRNVGELTYVLQTALSDYLKVKGLCYQTIAEISGAIHQLGRDFDQRVVEPYEAHKLVENGDVWPSWATYIGQSVASAQGRIHSMSHYIVHVTGLP